MEVKIKINTMSLFEKKIFLRELNVEQMWSKIRIITVL